MRQPEVYTRNQIHGSIINGSLLGKNQSQVEKAALSFGHLLHLHERKISRRAFGTKDREHAQLLRIQIHCKNTQGSYC